MTSDTKQLAASSAANKKRNPEFNAIVQGAQVATINLLTLQGHKLHAAKLRSCKRRSRCRQGYCAQCSYIRGLDLSNRCTAAVLAAADRYETINGKPLAMYAFTVKVDDVPVQELRPAVDLMALKLYEVISGYSNQGIILGSQSFMEAPHAESGGAAMQTFHPHMHGLIAIAKLDARTVLAFHDLPAEWDVEDDRTVKRTPLSGDGVRSYVTYCNKALPREFAEQWQGLLNDPGSFLARAGVMKNFQIGRFTGYFKPTAKRPACRATRRLQRLDQVTRREKIKRNK
jgi:hypothetical protein